jgi:hypothetical protein
MSSFEVKRVVEEQNRKVLALSVLEGGNSCCSPGDVDGKTRRPHHILQQLLERPGHRSLIRIGETVVNLYLMPLKWR